MLRNIFVRLGNLLNVLQIHDARLVQNHSFGRTEKQRHAQFFLQKLDMPGDGGLGEMQHAGGFGDALQFSHLAEDLQTIIHHGGGNQAITSSYALFLQAISH